MFLKMTFCISKNNFGTGRFGHSLPFLFPGNARKGKLLFMFYQLPTQTPPPLFLPQRGALVSLPPFMQPLCPPAAADREGPEPAPDTAIKIPGQGIFRKPVCYCPSVVGGKTPDTAINESVRNFPGFRTLGMTIRTRVLQIPA